MATPAQIAANRRNALKSTGPKTSEGRERSRMNALKHGLRSDQIVLPTEDADAFAAYHAAWVDDWKPTDQATLLLVDRAVAAGWKLKRTDRVEAARIGKRINTILGDWADARDRQVEYHLDRLATEPRDALDGLDAIPEGRGRVIELWEDVLDAASTPGGWSSETDHHERLLNLLGATRDDADTLTDADEAIADLSLRLLQTDNPAYRAATRSTALPAEVAATVAGDIARLAQARLDVLDEEAAAHGDPTPARLRQAETLACAIEPEDVDLHKLQGRLEREARSAIAQLTRLRSTRDARPEVETSSPDDLVSPVTNEPNPEPAPAPEPAPVTNEAKVKGQARTASPIVTNEANSVVAVGPVTRADRDRGGRTWPVVEAPGSADGPLRV